MKIAIDFDNVIYDHDGIWRGGELTRGIIAGADKAMRQLQYAGHDLIIFSTRNWNAKHRERIKEFMKSNEIPFSDISSKKPNADLYIDDKALRFTSWADVLVRVGYISNPSLRVLGINIQNPSNVGRLLRNAGEFKAEKIYLLNSANPKGLFQEEYLEIKNSQLAFDECIGFSKVAFHPKGKSVQLSMPEKLLCLFGGETEGISSDILEQCDFVIKIPTEQKYSCLTVDTAAGIAFNRWYEQWILNYDRI